MGHDARTTARRAVDALDAVPINVGFVRAVLDGTAAGDVWCDREDDPRAFHVVHPYGMSLVWGDDVPESVDTIVARIRARAASGRDEWLQVEPRWAGLGWDAALGAVPLDAVDAADAPAAVRHTRVNFAFDAGSAGARRPPQPPAGWRARPADARDFGMPGAVVPGEFWPDAAAFLEHGGGVVLERDGSVGAIAFASYRWDDNLEIGIETLPAVRRQGLAAAAAAALITTVRAAGLVPVWSCREDNIGSYRLAVSVGFTPTARLPYHHVLAAGGGAQPAVESPGPVAAYRATVVRTASSTT